MAAWSAEKFQYALRSRALGVRPIMAPNVFLLCGEQDWVEVTRAGYAYEYEIKMDRSDFYADFKKTTPMYSQTGWNVSHPLKHDLLSGKVAYTGRNALVLPKRFYFVFPAGLVKEASVPAYCGIIEGGDTRLNLVRQAPDLKAASKLSTKNYHSLLISMQERYFRTRIKECA